MKEDKKRKQQIYQFLSDLEKSVDGKEILDKFSKKTNKDKEEKTWLNKLFNSKKFQNPNKVAVLYLKNNGRAEPMDVQVQGGFFNINRKTYHERKDCIYTVGKDRLPLAIIPENNMFPIGTKDWADKSMQEKFSELQDHHLRAVRHAELVKMGDKGFNKMDNKKIIVWIIMGIIGISILMSYI